jgi:hypothetical protein
LCPSCWHQCPKIAAEFQILSFALFSCLPETSRHVAACNNRTLCSVPNQTYSLQNQVINRISTGRKLEDTVENDCSQSCRKLLDTRMAADGFFRWSYQTSVTTTTPNTSRYHRLFGTSVRLVRVTHCRVNMAHESGNGDRLQASVSGRDISAVRRNSLRLDKERSKFVSVCFSNGGTRFLGHGHDFASAASTVSMYIRCQHSNRSSHGSLLLVLVQNVRRHPTREEC